MEQLEVPDFFSGFPVIFPIVFFVRVKVMTLKCPPVFVGDKFSTTNIKAIDLVFPHMGPPHVDECSRGESGDWWFVWWNGDWINLLFFPYVWVAQYEKKWPEICDNHWALLFANFCLLIGSSISRILRKRWSNEAQQSPKNLSLHLRIPRWVEYVNLPCRTSIPMLRVVGRPGVYRDGFGNTWSFGTVLQRFWTFWGLKIFWGKKSNVQKVNIVINM